LSLWYFDCRLAPAVGVIRILDMNTSWNLSRRHFIRLAGGATLLSLLPFRLRGELPDFDTVSIFHTTDLHGNILPTSTYDGVPDVGGLARCATRLKQWRRQMPHHLTFDAGDLYQGTEVGLRTEGEVMIRCLNHLDFDGWVIGNHEFDWGLDAVARAVQGSAMPVLSANSSVDGVVAGKHPRGEHPFGNLAPYVIREVNGYRIALIGLTTPNMPNWFLPELLKGYVALDPAESARRAIDAILPEKPDAIIAVSHMGISRWRTEDNDANRLQSVIQKCPEIDVILAGHTHQHLSNERIGRAVYTQANYFGIHLGRVDLVFDQNSRQLIHAQPITSYMDSTVPLDGEIIALTANDIEEAEVFLDTPIGVLADELAIQSQPGSPSPLERLIGAAILEGLRRRGNKVDGAIHGLLFQDDPHPAGPKTVRDMWSIIPFENFTVLADLDREELLTVLAEVSRIRGHRSLMGMAMTVSGRGDGLTIADVRTADGQPLQPNRRYTVALNSYDAAGGGSRFPQLREILRRPETNRRLLPYQTRALLVEYFQDKETVSLADLKG